jgi:hypothetical protein
MSAAFVDAVDAYERLRAAMLGADPEASPNLGILRREGLTAWSRSLTEARDIDTPLSWPARQLPTWPDAAPAPNELTRLIAGIVLAIAVEPVHV